MFPQIGRTPDFERRFLEKRCGLSAGVYGTCVVELLVNAGPQTAVALNLFILADCGTVDCVAANLTLLKWPSIVKFCKS